MNSSQAPSALARDATLLAIADIVLPSELGVAGRQKVVAAFVEWNANYKEGADRGYGYGASTIAAPTGLSPERRYPEQFAALDSAAREKGAASFSALAAEARRGVIEAALSAGQGVTRLPPRPTGASVIADLMGFYFNSADAWNLAYGARIDRDSCRGLAASEQPPAPIRGR